MMGKGQHYFGSWKHWKHHSILILRIAENFWIYLIQKHTLESMQLRVTFHYYLVA